MSASIGADLAHRTATTHSTQPTTSPAVDSCSHQPSHPADALIALIGPALSRGAAVRERIAEACEAYLKASGMPWQEARLLTDTALDMAHRGWAESEPRTITAA